MKKTFALYTALTLTATCSNLIVQAEPRFAVIHLENLGLDPSNSNGLNEFGEVVGASRTPANDLHAFRWVNGMMIDLNPDLLGSAQALGNNELGQVIGMAGFEGQLINRRAFLWENGAMLDLGTLGGVSSRANAINNSGQVVGWANFEMASGRQRAFLWQDGIMTQIGPDCDGCGSSAADINTSGQIVGVSVSPDTGQTAVIWDADGTMTELARFGARNGAFGLNDRGQIVGFSGTALLRAVLWEDGKVIQLDFDNTFGSNARNINNHGIIVGISFFGRDHGALWDAQQRQYNLNSLLAPLNRWWIDEAIDINDQNQIAVNLKPRKNSGFRFFAGLLTPVNPTFKIFAPQPGRAGEINTISAGGGNLKPGSVVDFYWGVRGGGTRIDDCNLLDAVLQIENARHAGSAIADENGIATLERFLPQLASGQNIFFQAITGPDTPTGCAQSQIIGMHFE